MASNLLLAIFSAILSGISIPNEVFVYGLWPVGFVSLAPLYIALCRASSPRQAALAAGTFGALQHAITSYWLFFYKDFALWTIGATTVAYFFVYALVGLYGAFLLRSQQKVFRPFVFALFWVCFEYLKSIGFLGYPWGLVPYSLTSVPVLLQISDITGVYGVTFLLSLCSANLAEILLYAGSGEKHKIQNDCQERQALAPLGYMTERRLGWSVPLLNTTIFTLVLLSLVLGYGVYSQKRVFPVKATLRMLLVQQNTDPWLAGEKAALTSNLLLAKEALQENSAKHGNPIDLTVFSETSLSRPYNDFKPWYWENPKEQPLIPYILASGAPLLTGAPVVLDYDTQEMTNSVILISKDGEQVDSYAKMHPVPFAEAIPFWEYSWFRNFMQRTIGLESGWVMGTRYTVFSIEGHEATGNETMGNEASSKTVSFSTPICFEDAFADLCRRYILLGADLFVNLTNDSWSRTVSAQVQHWSIARIRAIENRRTLVRSTNSGVSSVVGPHGETLFEMPQFRALARIVDVPVYTSDTLTIYTKYGDWFSWLCLFGVILMAIKGFITAHGRWPLSTTGMLVTECDI